MIIALTCLIAVAVVAYIIGVRPKDLPDPEPVSPFDHLDERKAAIYENLRDLQFEYRLGKLSDEDYQSTKKDLQKELAKVMADVDKLRATLQLNGAVPSPAPVARPKSEAKAAAQPAQAKPANNVCPSCGAEFAQDLKFCGECGKPMKAAAQ